MTDTSPDLPHSDWQNLYNAALQEQDRSKVQQRIATARRALTERMRILGELQTASPQERKAILDALNGLAMLERGSRK